MIGRKTPGHVYSIDSKRTSHLPLLNYHNAIVAMPSMQSNNLNYVDGWKSNERMNPTNEHQSEGDVLRGGRCFELANT
jgi:hypothetical protein